jgi:hypothetical protein
MAGPVPRVVVVTRSTSYEALLERHATRGQAQFFLENRGEDIGVVEAGHQRFQQALAVVLQSIPPRWRRAQVDRRDLDRFLFEPEDIIAAVGQRRTACLPAAGRRGPRVPRPERVNEFETPSRRI